MTNFLFPRSYLAGLVHSVAGGSSTFNISAGQCADSTNASIMNSVALAKTTGAWAPGNGGALDTGTIAPSTWYHVHQIEQPAQFMGDTPLVDTCISLSAVAPTFGVNIPNTYTLSRRHWAMKTDASSNWIKFVQFGDRCVWNVPFADVSNYVLGSISTLFPLSVPPGVLVDVTFGSYWSNSSSPSYVTIQSPLLPTQVANVPAGNISLTSPANGVGITGQFTITTDTSQNIRAVASAGVVSPSFFIVTQSYLDRRGRDA